MNDINNNVPRAYTEELFELFQRFRNEERLTNNRNKEKLEATQLVSSIYKRSEIIRTFGRGATEIFEQLKTIREGEISGEETNAILEEASESAKRLADFSWTQSKQQDEEAREFAIKTLKLIVINDKLGVLLSISLRKAKEHDEERLVTRGSKQIKVKKGQALNISNLNGHTTEEKVLKLAKYL
ncbi:hypothetical protein G6F37_011992 [Rhizopus arrhizus]|nr:hypothetical protein G6F38_007031 [Rhizopus arrhizus]KAG1146307.1 hypothetical protein G6F37_011992 [Rhizopus arrhizus]